VRLPVKLVPGGILPRDPSLVVRLQRKAAPAVAPPTEAPAPPAPDNGLLDNYDGTGSIADHTADTGQTYQELYASSTAEYVLDGSGDLTFSGADSFGRWFWVNWLPPSGDYFVEFDVIIDAGAGGALIGIVGLNNGSDYNGWELDFGYDVSASSLKTRFRMMPIGVTAIDRDTLNAVGFGSHTVRMEITAGATIATSFIDGAQQDTATMAALPRPFVIALYMQLGPGDESKIRASALRGNAL
jgi:hypothetical protein